MKRTTSQPPHSSYATSQGRTGATAPERVGLSETARLETFSDGVFAIAITLLVLEIRVPPSHGALPLGVALRALWPSYLGYAISFITIGIMWVNHHSMFRHIRRADRSFLLLNVLFLLVLAFIPFPTAVLAEHLTTANGGRTAALLFGSTYVGMALAFNLVWRYGAGRAHLLAPDVDRETVQTITRLYTLGPVLYLTATLLAFASVAASLALHGALALSFALPEGAALRLVSRRGA